MDEIERNENSGNVYKGRQELFRAVFGLLPVLTMCYDADLKFLHVNKEFEIKTGWSAGDMDPVEFLNCCYPEPVARMNILEHMVQARREWKEFTLTKKGGGTLPIAWANAALQDGMHVGIGIDVSRWNTSEKALLESQRQLQQAQRLAATGRLAASIAHEINNPLQAIFSNFGMLEQSALFSDDQLRNIEQIRLALNRIKNTVQNLLDLHRTRRPNHGPIDVHSVLHSIIRLFDNQLKINKIKVIDTLGAGNPYIIGSAQDLYQIFMNLILNAQDALDGGGSIRLGSECEGRRLKLIIEDDGCGIAASNIEYIFEPFFTTKSRSLGTGLGLATVKALVESQEGTIAVESRINEGTKFTITFPSTEPA